MKKLLLVLITIALIVATAVYALPSVLTKTTQKALSDTLQTEVTVNNIEVSLLDGTFSVQGLTIKDYPKFSEGNLFVLNNLVFTFDPMSLISDTITIKELTVAGIQLNLTGGLKENSIKELQHVLALNEQVAKQEKAAEEEAHKNGEVQDHSGHAHAKKELNLRIEQLNINDIAIAATITDPIELPKKELKLAGLNIQNIGGEKGVNVNNLLKDIVENIDLAVTSKIEEILPAQKVYEDT
ncbi:MAG TPA: hypothetical protein DCL21_00605, partial [Alphaproteobacteria bacterium]|nr:hypothetical protein [Alphaproteobacteria bacterium]